MHIMLMYLVVFCSSKEKITSGNFESLCGVVCDNALREGFPTFSELCLVL